MDFSGSFQSDNRLARMTAIGTQGRYPYAFHTVLKLWVLGTKINCFIYGILTCAKITKQIKVTFFKSCLFAGS
jgi:hypothetical protein